MVPQLITSFYFGLISLKIIILIPQLLLHYSIWYMAVNFNPNVYGGPTLRVVHHRSY